MTGAIQVAAGALGDLPRRIVLAAAAEIWTGVVLIGLAILAASTGSSWGDIPIWLGVIGALGLVSGLGLLYRLRLARATSLAFGLVVGVGALISLLAAAHPSSRWWTVLPLVVLPLVVLAASAVVIYGSETLTVRRLGALLAVVVLWVWIIPAVAGPKVTCINIDPVACEEAWQGQPAGGSLWQSIFPLTEVRVENYSCPQMYLQWGPFEIFTHHPESLC